MQPLDLLLLHTAATWALVGLIWTVQLVQYPGFARVGPAELASFHAHHSRRITWIVAPLMGCELLTGLALLGARSSLTIPFLWIGLGLIGFNWACTAFVAVPLHGRLSGRRREVQRLLVATNWLRTAAWSLRGVWTLVALQSVMGEA